MSFLVAVFVVWCCFGILRTCIAGNAAERAEQAESALVYDCELDADYPGESKNTQLR